MHISQMAKVLTGQRKKEYEPLDGFFTLKWVSTSSVNFIITSLAGNKLYVNWDDDNDLTAEEEFITTGSTQTLSHSYSNNRERSVKVRGSGVYVMTRFQCSDNSYLSGFPFDSENCSMLPNLKQLYLYSNSYFQWDEDANWSLLPKLNTIDIQSNGRLSGFSVIDPNISDNYPTNLNTLYIQRTQLSGITIRNYEPIKNIALSGMSSLKYCDLEGCSNIREIMFRNDSLTSANLKNCSGLTSAYFRDAYRLNNISFESCNSLHTARLHSLNYYGEEDDFIINWDGCDSLTGVFIADSKSQSVFPAPSATPNIKVLSGVNISGGLNEEFKLNDYSSLTGVSFESIYGLKNLYCSGNRSLVSARFYRLYELDNLEFENCTQLSSLNFYGTDYDGYGTYKDLEYIKLMNCPRLGYVALECCDLSYGYDIEDCNALSSLYMNYTNIKNAYINNFPNLQYLYLQGNGEYSKLNKVYIENCPILRQVYIRDNRYSLTDFYIKDCNNYYLDIENRYCYSLNKITFENVGMYVSDINDFLYYLNEYSGSNAGQLNFINTTYLPSGTYISNLTDKGWTYNVS